MKEIGQFLQTDIGFALANAALLAVALLAAAWRAVLQDEREGR